MSFTNDQGAGESQVRSYSRSFPTVFTTSKGDLLRDHDGVSYIDFLSGAGSLNYGHNPEPVKRQLIEYLERDGLTHGLDLTTSAKLDFLHAFQSHVLRPRGLDYRVQFCSPSGTNAVEAALKLARLVTGRTNVIAFSGAFHGVSAGSLAATASDYYRAGLHGTLTGTTHLPYPDSPLGGYDTLDLLRRMVEDPNAGTPKPAAVLLETVQGEGGVYLAPPEFLRGLRELCDRHQILLIVDDIQAGCGRTGRFFSFERAGIVPDLVTLSKSISGYGLPMAIVLIKPEYDVWRPGQHNGTFRGHQLAFVAAAAVLDEFWADGPDGVFAAAVRAKGRELARRIGCSPAMDAGARLRGVGLIWGLDLSAVRDVSAGKISNMCFDRGLIVETCGRNGEVIKILPPLTISEEHLAQGLDVLLTVLRLAIEDAPTP
ncbi:diaminobutyrate--2-oxoglutarate transaminase [Micromonospora sp. NPDC005979]|uniref:diaminobutyrate--2-oxoglutarate transaminase n=1 Tax=Micromonospora sp. NPDC005979 TaxID=3156726 RepID=UPI0033BE9234